MTSTRSKVRRVTHASYAVLYRKARPIVVTIAPGDILEFREKGRRGVWSLAIDTAFKYAVRVKAFADAAERHRAKKCKSF